MTLKAGLVKEYGTFMNITLAKKSKPGDGKFGRGKKG
ncbi:lariocidin family lasso peptide [Paenibacillus tarimensis]